MSVTWALRKKRKRISQKPTTEMNYVSPDGWLDVSDTPRAKYHITLQKTPRNKKQR